MNTLISIDPGVSSAIAVIEYDDCCPPALVECEQFTGGTEALIERANGICTKYPDAHILCEDFTARSNGSFGYTTTSLEPLVGIGALVAMGLIDRKDRNQMCAPTLQYFLPGKTLAEKKKKRRIWLAENGFKVMPKDVGQPDADDVRSAISHGIAWLRRQKHLPTLGLFRKDGDD